MPNTLHGLTYFVQVFGCQMNEHDAERVAGLLESQGCTRADNMSTADIAVFMTCSVRKKADTHLYARAQDLKSASLPSSGKRTICIGGCIAQRDGEALIKHVPVVDVVFGTQALKKLPELIVEAREKNRLCVDTFEPNDAFSSELPSVRASHAQAWLPIMSGCNNFCTYCIVPYVRGRERSRPFAEIVDEASALVEDGVEEITLLGQNVNSYRPASGETFVDVLHAVSRTGVRRIRFTSSHPKDLSSDIIDAMATHPNIMPHLHLAVQSGSDAVLSRMNRRYTQAHYLELVQKLREKIPHIALTTDLIVGFPKESEADFEATLELVKKAEFSSAYTFIYSRRPGTKAASMELGYTKDEVHSRFNRLVKLISEQSYAFNQRFLNATTEVLVEGTSKKDDALLTGHNPENICVHFEGPNELIGSIVPVKIDLAQTWYLKGTRI